MKTEQDYQRVYAGINLDAVMHNLEKMHTLIKDDTKIIAVIKTDGYGHGAVPIAKKIESLPYLWGFAVATQQEGTVLRRHGIKKPVLILGHSFEEEFERIVEDDLEPAIFTYESAKVLSETAKRLKKTAKIHIKIDTGMSRIGYQVSEASADEIAKTAELKNLKIEGVFTHFAKADEADKTHVHGQIAAYQKMLTMLEERGVEIPLKHCSNSAGIIDFPDMKHDLARAGISIYGMYPSDEVKKDAVDLKPALELISHISFVKDVEKGTSISYGGTFVAPKKMRIATIPVGYGDGYPRSLSNKGYVLIHGKRADIVGRVCMDQFMVDVTEIPEAKFMDPVTLVGKDKDAVIRVEDLSDLSGRFNYEFVCDLSKRVPREYYKNGTIVKQIDYFE